MRGFMVRLFSPQCVISAAKSPSLSQQTMNPLHHEQMNTAAFTTLRLPLF